MLLLFDLNFAKYIHFMKIYFQIFEFIIKNCDKVTRKICIQAKIFNYLYYIYIILLTENSQLILFSMTH